MRSRSASNQEGIATDMNEAESPLLDMERRNRAAAFKITRASDYRDEAVIAHLLRRTLRHLKDNGFDGG